MSHAVEDEVDWSDGTLDPPSPGCIQPAAGSSRLSPVLKEHGDYDSLFLSGSFEEHNVPCGIPLDLALSSGNDAQPTLSRAQRARIGVRLNRRRPSKEDYSNFALYQASQKAYEATFFKNFVAHALHSDQIDKCFTHGSDFRANLNKYLKSVSANVKCIANKMVWNAHCRMVNLLANDGKAGAPFLDVHTFNSDVFSHFGPGSTPLIARKMNDSWHHEPKPAMVRLSTKEYPIGYHNAPLEDIDEVADTLFNKDAFGTALPTGRAAKPSTKKKGKGRDLPGAAAREEQPVTSRGNWLAFPSFEAPIQHRSPPPAIFTPRQSIGDVEMFDADQEPKILADLRNVQHGGIYKGSPIISSKYASASGANQTQLETLFDRYGAKALDGDRVDSPAGSNSGSLVEKVPSWRMRLIDDHKCRLTERWGNPLQAYQRALPGIKQVLAQAIAMGFRPTDDDHREKVELIAAREQKNFKATTRSQEVSMTQKTRPSTRRTETDHAKNENTNVIDKIPNVKKLVESPKKKRKTSALFVTQPPPKTPAKPKTVKAKFSKQSANHQNSPTSADYKLLAPHPSGSTTLERHQILPPDAYFEPTSIDETPVWRCGIKHAMGHYYNAGDRKNCRGCNTSISGNPKLVRMDFYMPSRSFFHQPAPDIHWKPGRPSSKARKSDRPCHNSVAKDAYWAAIDAGASGEEARQIGINAVAEFLRPKPRKEPTLEPTPEPEPDLGPHPSGSITMEHGQDIPECAYLEKHERDEEYAWRCDVSHALGRYYLAGDKKSCPGCGSNKNGLGKQAVMDFYMPPGVILRQEASDLTKWKPRKYKARKTSATKITKAKSYTHNQICAEKYFQAIEEGYEDKEALELAIERTDAYLDKKQEEAVKKHEEQDEDEETEEIMKSKSESSSSRRDPAKTSQASSVQCDPYRRNSRGGCTVSLVPKKRKLEDLRNEEVDKVENHETPKDWEGLPASHEVMEISSAEEESSVSDSE